MTKHSAQWKNDIAVNNTILRTQVGSPVHGLNIKEQDDRDEMGICIEPPENVIGSKQFDQYEFRTQPDGSRSGPGDLDLVIYSLRKWMNLALKGNPTILLPLWVEEKEVMVRRHLGHYLRANRQDFLSIRAVKAHLGYLHNQRERMLGLRGGMDVNRPELVEAYGFDTKYAGHMVRLGVQGLEIASEGRLTLPMTDEWRTTIRSIRTGGYTKAQTLELAKLLEADIENAIPKSDLPPFPPVTKWEQWMIGVYLNWWKDGR